MWWILLLMISIFFFPQIGIFGPYFTIVKEGTGKIVLRLGGYRKGLLCWKDHDIDEDGNIIDAPGKKSRGLQFVGFRNIDTLLRYKFRWKDIQLINGKEEEQPHEIERDWVLVRPDVYIITLEAAETKPPEERIPINVSFVYTFRIINIRKATLDAPPNWFENVTTRLNAAHRNFVASHRLDELLSKKETKIEPEEIDKEFIKDVMEEKWGIKTEDIAIRDIGLSPDYQKAAAAEREAKMKAAGRAEEIIGTVIAAVAIAEGRDEKEIQKEFQESPEDFYRKHKPIIDNTITKLSMEEKAYLRIETPGATGALGDLLCLLGAGLRMPMGPSEEEEKKEEKETETSSGSEGSEIFKVFKEKRPMEKIHQWKKRKKRK